MACRLLAPATPAPALQLCPPREKAHGDASAGRLDQLDAALRLLAERQGGQPVLLSQGVSHLALLARHGRQALPAPSGGGAPRCGGSARCTAAAQGQRSCGPTRSRLGRRPPPSHPTPLSCPACAEGLGACGMGRSPLGGLVCDEGRQLPLQPAQSGSSRCDEGQPRGLCPGCAAQGKAWCAYRGSNPQHALPAHPSINLGCCCAAASSSPL